MQNTEANQRHSDTESVGSDGGGEKNSRSSLPDAINFSNSCAHSDGCVEITVDVHEDGVKAGGLEKKSSFGSSVVRNTSSRIRQVSQGIKRLASLTVDLQPGPRFDRKKSAAVHALKGLKFISKSDGAAWTAVLSEFTEITSKTNGLLPRSQFGKCIGMKGSEEFACRLFDVIARRRNISGEYITEEQLKDFWDQIADQSFDCRLEIFFDMVDKDADGRITEDEVREIISFSASANRLSNIQTQADEYARLIMEELDPDKCGYVMIDKLEMLLLQGGSDSEREGGESRDLSKMLSKQLKPTQDNLLKRWFRGGGYLLADNWQRLWVMAVWVGVMAALFANKYVQYRRKAAFEVMGHCVCMAKGAAETLKLNMALILLPMCRNTITWLRNKTTLGLVVPFDDGITFHQIVAMAIAVGVGIHGISHLACDFPRVLNASAEKYELMKKYLGDDQPTSYWHFVKGWEGVTGIAMVVLMGIAFTLASPIFRRNRVHLPKPFDKITGFNAFWYSHHLFIVVYTLLIVHGLKLYLTHVWYHKTTWMYLAIPLTLYAGERLIRAFRSSIKPVKILKVEVYPGNVLKLHMSKPDRFRYKSGQYIFVNCSAVSPFEWHPFSITSAPGDDYLSVHIRAVGDWTKRLRFVFSKVCETPSSGDSDSEVLRADFREGENNPNVPKVLIDGPYGAPTQDYKGYDVVLLVGLGIGATPMISVVKDIINNIKYKEEDEKENVMEEGKLPSPMPKRNSGSDFKIKRAYFYWVTREQGSFDWFKGVMNDVAEMDERGVIEMHNYCTSVYEEGDARSALIAMLQSINHAKNGVDIVSGTRFKSHFAKPNWRSVYKNITLNHPNSRVGVFYCGAPALVAELRHLAHDFSHKTSTKFEFHKENF